MATLNETNGPSDALAGVMPAPVEDRDGRRHWLVFDCTSVYACHTSSSDLARALVLNRLGYGSRPELADQLDARPASQREVTTVCQRKRVKPLQVTPQIAGRVSKIARAIYVQDLHHAGADRDGEAAQSSTPSTRKAAGRAHARQMAATHAATPGDRVQSR
jgi:hypothetical protein